MIMSMVGIGTGMIGYLIMLLIDLGLRRWQQQQQQQHDTHDSSIFSLLVVQDDAMAPTPWIGFLLGMMYGTGMSSVVFRVVSSAVDTIVVCFAEAPQIFQQHHPVLAQELVEAWRLVYPNECGL